MIVSDTIDLNGILLIDKPAGCTSHDVVDRVRRKLGLKRVGHAGTLDPLATGLLVLLVGKATSASQYLTNLNKIYEAAIHLGKTTDTFDADGSVVSEAPVPDFSKDVILETFQSFKGDQYQIPPMFSAKKVNGVPLYKLARKGQTVEREAKLINISDIELQSFDSPIIRCVVKCSKGTYIRTLAHDIGQKLGCGAHLAELRRIGSGDLDISNAIRLDTLQALSLSEIKNYLIPPYKAIPVS